VVEVFCGDLVDVLCRPDHAGPLKQKA